MASSNSPLFLGLDLGGTNIKAGVVDDASAILGQISIPTGTSPDVIIANLARASHDAVRAANTTLDRIAAAGIVSPGQLDIPNGLVLRAANLTGWVNVPLRDRVAAAIGRPAVLENDANAAAYGEYWVGEGQNGKIKNLVLLTLGTGIGGGIINEGKLIHGSQSFAGEPGHMIVVPDGDLCGCGQHGCLEVYASASRTGTRATRMLKSTMTPSTLREPLIKNGEVTSADVANHAAHGDALALEIWHTTCKYLAIAIVNIIHMTDPELIVLAGGMVKAGSFLLDTVRQHLNQQWWKLTPLACTIAISPLGNDAGLVGAAGVAKHAFDHHTLPKCESDPSRMG